jgi:hypothetical protein
MDDAKLRRSDASDGQRARARPLDQEVLVDHQRAAREIDRPGKIYGDEISRRGILDGPTQTAGFAVIQGRDVNSSRLSAGPGANDSQGTAKSANLQ